MIELTVYRDQRPTAITYNNCRRTFTTECLHIFHLHQTLFHSFVSFVHKTNQLQKLEVQRSIDDVAFINTSKLEIFAEAARFSNHKFKGRATTFRKSITFSFISFGQPSAPRAAKYLNVIKIVFDISYTF